MKTVFNSIDDVIHAFAQRPNDPNTEGRTSGGGNVFFDGVSLYSFGRHYELARYLDPNTVLINDLGYSKTTGKHISKAQHALSQYKRFYVTGCDPMQVRIRLEAIRKRLATARKPEKYVSEALHIIERYNEWRQYHADHLEAFQRRPGYTPTELPIIGELLQLINAEDFTERIKAARDAEKKRKATAAESFRSAFKNFEPFEKYRNAASLPYSLIRINGDQVETSQNVRIPIEEARRAWKLYKLGQIKHGDAVGGYKVIAATADQVRIGCHLLNVTDLREVLG
jgi:hypothetical protein